MCGEDVSEKNKLEQLSGREREGHFVSRSTHAFLDLTFLDLTYSNHIFEIQKIFHKSKKIFKSLCFLEIVVE